MKILGIIAGLVLFVMVSVLAIFPSRQANRFQNELHQVREQFHQSSEALAVRKTQVQSLQDELNDLREDLAELPRLRGQVASLRSQASSAQTSMRQAKKELKELQAASAIATGQDPVAQVVTTRSVMSVDQLPPPIQSYLQSRFPGATVREVERIVEEDGIIYATEGSAANERDWHAVFNEKGELLEQVMELSMHEAPEAVRLALSQQFGGDVAVHLEQAWEDGRTRYLSNAEAHGEERHMDFTEDGQLVRYETWVEPPERDDLEVSDSQMRHRLVHGF